MREWADENQKGDDLEYGKKCNDGTQGCKWEHLVFVCRELKI